VQDRPILHFCELSLWGDGKHELPAAGDLPESRPYRGERLVAGGSEGRYTGALRCRSSAGFPVASSDLYSSRELIGTKRTGAWDAIAVPSKISTIKTTTSSTVRKTGTSEVVPPTELCIVPDLLSKVRQVESSHKGRASHHTYKRRPIEKACCLLNALCVQVLVLWATIMKVLSEFDVSNCRYPKSE
jgi:hypothetical protein